MSNRDIDRLLLEMLLESKFKTPTVRTPREDRDRDITVKQLLRVLRKTPELKKELEEALKALEPKKEEKKKGSLTFGQKYMLWTIAAVTVPPLYIVLMSKLFATIGVQ